MAIGLAMLAFAAPAPAAAPELHRYNLGVVRFDDGGPRGPLPVRLWGAIAIPDGSGRHPVVVVAHGRHSDNCPIDRFDFPTWPCYAREQRNDLGFNAVLRALAARGILSVAPDLNGAFTAGWGEPNDRRRWPMIVNRVLNALRQDSRAGGRRFGVQLRNRVDPDSVGVLGHSLSGANAVRFALRRGAVRSLFLLTPVVGGGRLPDLPAAIVIATCDGDAELQGRSYFGRARDDPRRERPAWLVRLEGPNHNYFNRTLARERQDDAESLGPECRVGRRPRAVRQQEWLAGVAAGFFARTLRSAPLPAWMRRARLEGMLYGIEARVTRSQAGS